MSTELLLQLLLGAILGIVGQLIRFLVGYYKMFDQAQQNQVKVKDMFVPARFWISVMIGFVAGILGMVSISTFKADFFAQNVKQTILTLIASGYAGADFIEGFIRKYIPGQDNTTQTGQPANSGNAPAPGGTAQPSADH